MANDDTRDYRKELQQGLEKLFHDSFTDYNLQMKANCAPIYRVHYTGPIAHSTMSSEYILTVYVHLNACNFYHHTGKRALDWMGPLTIGEFCPVTVEQSMDLPFNQTLLKVEYRIYDLDLFLQQLLQKAWHEFDESMTNMIDSLLDDESH